MLQQKWCLGLVFLFLSHFGAFSNGNKEKHFSTIALQDGITQSTVISIVQDRDENMWFATFDGLNRYDGYSFTHYQYDSKNKNSIMSDELRVLFKDVKQEIWIGSKRGLSHYIYEKDHFENFILTNSKDNSIQINTIIELNSTTLLLGTETGLFTFDKQKKEFKTFESTLSSNMFVRNLCKIEDKILIGTNKGLFLYHQKQNQVIPINSKLRNIDVQVILTQSESRIWIGTEGDGLFLLNLQSGELKQFKHQEGNENSISSNYIRSLILDTHYQLWIGTFNGLSILNNSDDTFSNFQHNYLAKKSLSQNSIRSLYMDSQGGIWLGTYYGAINYYHALKNQFGHIQQAPYINSLNDRVVSCIVEDKNGEIWIGTNDMGINIYNPTTKKYKYINKENSPNLISNNIKTFLLSNDGKSIYVGSHGGGLVKIEKETGKVIRIPNFDRLNSANVYSLAYDNEGNVWIGTLMGLHIYNETTQKIMELKTPFLSSSQIMYLKKDTHNQMWIGKDKSFSVYSLDKKELRNIKDDDLSETSINSIYEDTKHRIWIASNRGLIQYLNNGKIRTYSQSSGLPSNRVYGILEDSFGRLWLSTSNGVSNFNPDTREFQNYTNEDGIPFRQFNMYSFCSLKNGMMWFGGVNGILTFYPELLIDNPYTPQPRISRIEVQNKTVLPFDDTKILKNNIYETDFLKIHSKFSTFSLELNVPNYLSNQHNTFAYRLKGFEKEWRTTTSHRTISYSNLSYGKYKFEIKAANNDGKWNNSIKTITIKILPKWYQTWYSKIIFFLLALFIGYHIFRFFRQRELMKQQLYYERLEKEKMEEVNQMKLRFFINISHEFKTPLTLILSPIQELLSKTTEKWQKTQLIYIQKNANKLLHLVNQLMDYRRAELGVFELKVGKYIISRLVYDTFILFDKYAKRKNIDYLFLDHTGDKEFLIDKNYFEIILTNLLSNAFKFTPDGGSVTVRIEEDINFFYLEVSDTGEGISKEEHKLIFERFYQVDTSNNIGSGIGLSLIKRLVELHHGHIKVDSEKGKGSTFSIYFPQDVDAYNPNELELKDEKQISAEKNSKLDFILGEFDDQQIETEEENEEKSATILIAEDNLEIQQYLQERLSKKYNVILTRNGIEALETLKNEEVDLILSDVMMPEMDGIKLCKTVKQNIRTCHIPFIILSAKSNLEDQLQGLEVGADDYVAKPFTFSVLSMKIQNMLKSRQRILGFYSKTSEVEPEKITFNAMDEQLLTKAKKIVMDNLANSEFSVDLFCSEMGMSRSNLHLKLKAITGESTIDFIKKIRFNEACKLLLDGRYNITEVSTMVGFNTPSYFATSFKNYFGYLPTEYVKNRRHQQN